MLKRNFDFIPGLSVNQDFFELLRRIDAHVKDIIRLGESDDKYYKRIRIIQTADLSFASREVYFIQQKNKKDNQLFVIVYIRNFGFFSPYGPMPIYVTEHARSEIFLYKNKIFEQFLGLLMQRMAIFYYRSWAQLHPMVCYDKPNYDTFFNHIKKLSGVSSSIERNKHIEKLRSSFPAAYLIRRKSLKQLQKILLHYFRVPIVITPRNPIWIYDSNSSRYQKMGKIGEMRIGSRFYDVEHSALIEVGPLGENEYEDFDRGQEKLLNLIEVCNDFVNNLIIFNVILYIRTSSKWEVRLKNLKMGKNSWLKPQDKVHKKLVYSVDNNIYGRGK